MRERLGRGNEGEAVSLMPTDNYGEQCNTPEQDTPGIFSCTHCRTRAAIISRAIHFSSGLAWRCYAIYRNAEMDVLFNDKEKMAKGIGGCLADVPFTYRHTPANCRIDQYAFGKDHFCHSAFK